MARAYIAVSGNIGTGKSSLVEFLCRYFDLTPLPEPNDDNPYLADFYKDMRAWSFHSQLFFLSRKIAMFEDIRNAPCSIIQDRAIYEDAEIFCRNLYNRQLMRKRDFELYMYLYEQSKRYMPTPDLLIHLSCPQRVINRRIKLRGRRMEQTIPPSYLKKLQILYDEWIASWDACPVVHLDTSELDFVNDLIDQSDVLQRVSALVTGICR